MANYNLNRLKHFVEVARSGSFTAAADKLGLGKAVVSHQVAKLEEELGATLFVRTTRSINLTSVGENFYEQAITILALADSAALEVQQEQEQPSGQLVVTAPEDFGRLVVVKVLMKLRETYPKLHINAIFTDEKLDLIREKIDVSIRVGWLEDSSRIARKIGSFRQYLVASPSYIARLGPVISPLDVHDSDWIHNTKLTSTLSWISDETGEEHSYTLTDPKITVSNAATAHLCAVRSGGICVLPSYHVRNDIKQGDLEILLPNWKLPAGGIYIVYPNMSFRPARTKAFVMELIKQQKLLVEEN